MRLEAKRQKPTRGRDRDRDRGSAQPRLYSTWGALTFGVEASGGSSETVACVFEIDNDVQVEVPVQIQVVVVRSGGVEDLVDGRDG